MKRIAAIIIMVSLLWASPVFGKHPVEIITSTNEVKLRATGYFVSGYRTKAQAKMEGGKHDRFGNELRTLQDYTEGSYVSVATDPRVIKTGTVLHIKEIPGVTFVACDVGSAIKGKRIDICCYQEKDTRLLPKHLTITKIAYIPRINQYRHYGFGSRINNVISLESPQSKQQSHFLVTLSEEAQLWQKLSLAISARRTSTSSLANPQRPSWHF